MKGKFEREGEAKHKNMNTHAKEARPNRHEYLLVSYFKNIILKKDFLFRTAKKRILKNKNTTILEPIKTFLKPKFNVKIQ